MVQWADRWSTSSCIGTIRPSGLRTMVTCLLSYQWSKGRYIIVPPGPLWSSEETCMHHWVLHWNHCHVGMLLQWHLISYQWHYVRYTVLSFHQDPSMVWRQGHMSSCFSIGTIALKSSASRYGDICSNSLSNRTSSSSGSSQDSFG